MENNIFKYAPNELVQDAFICWLLNWINTKNDDENIKEVAKNILEKIISDYKNKNNINENCEIDYTNLQIIPQHSIKLDNYRIYDENNKKIFRKKKNIKEINGRIDILVIVDKYAIIIEDKVNTGEHDFQIYQYKKALQNLNKKEIEKLTDVEKQILNKEVITCYYKIFDECNIKDKIYIDSKFEREEIIHTLKKYNQIKNLYYTQYIEYLEEIEKVSKSLIKDEKIDLNNVFLKPNTIIDIQYLGLFKNIQEWVEKSKDIFPEQKVYWGKANESGSGDTWWCNIETAVEVMNSKNFRKRAFLKINAYKDNIKIRLMIGKKSLKVEENKNREENIRFIYEFNNEKYTNKEDNCIEVKYQIKNKDYNTQKKNIFNRLEQQKAIDEIKEVIGDYELKIGGNSGNYEITIFTIKTGLTIDSDKIYKKLRELLESLVKSLKEIKITELEGI